MATVGLYGSSSSGVVAAASGSESTGLYGNNVNFGGSYFEWFIFQQSDLQPATPTGGSWSFSTNTGVAPTGWSSVPPSNPTNKIWVSIALVNSKNASPLEWSVPGLFSYASGLPILSANGVPGPGDGQSDQLYIQLDTTPQTIWFKESGTWTRLTGSTLYVDLTSNQTIAGTKTFSSQIQGSVSGTAGNVTGVVGIANGGTGSTTASGARTALGAAASGANSDITSLSGVTGGISTPDFVQFDTGITPAVGVGKLQWDPTNGCMQVGLVGGNVNLQIGQETVAYIYNNTGATITEGQIVRVVGSQGQRLTVALAQADGDPNSATILGMATENIANNSSGFITTQGIVNNVNTNGFADGTLLYLSPTVPGGFTATKPVAPQHLVWIGYVVKGNSGGAGSIYIHTQNGYELDELHNVRITDPVADNSFLVYDTALEVWQNEAPATARTSLGLGSAAVLNAGVANGVATLDAGGTVPLSQIPASIQGGVSYQGTWNASTNTPTLTSGVGTKGYYYVVSVAGNTNLNGVTAWNIGDWAIFNGTAWEKVDNTDAVTSVNGYTGTVVLTQPDIAGTASLSTVQTLTNKTFGDNPTFSAGTANGVAYLNGSKVLTTGSALTFDGTNLGVGTSSPGATLGVSGQVSESFTGSPTIVSKAYWTSNPVDGGYFADYACFTSNFNFLSQSKNQSAESGGGIIDAQFVQQRDGDTVNYTAIGQKISNAVRGVTTGSFTSGVFQQQYKDLVGGDFAAIGRISWNDRGVSGVLGQAIQYGTGIASNEFAVQNPSAANEQSVSMAAVQAIVRAQKGASGAGNKYRGVLAQNDQGFRATSAFEALSTAGSGSLTGNFEYGLHLSGARVESAAITMPLSQSGDVGTVIQYDTNDFTFYDRTNNRFGWTVNGNTGVYVTETSIGIGTSSPTAPLDVNGNIAITGSARRITGDFSNATIANRVMFQTSTVNGQTSIGVLPNGTSTSANLNLFGGTDPANASIAQIVNTGGEVSFRNAITGTGTSVPMTFYTGGSERMRLDTSGRLLLGTSAQIASSTATLQIAGSGVSAGISLGRTDTPVSSGSFVGIDAYAFDGTLSVVGGTINFRAAETWSSTNHGTDIQFRTTASGSGGALFEAMRITSAGNLGIGTSSPSARVHSYVGSAAQINNLIQNTVSYLNYGVFADGNNYVYSGTATNLLLGTNNTERMRIDSIGNVGIGTSSPGNALVVSRGAGSAAYVQSISGANTSLFGHGAGGELVTGSFSNQPYLFFTNSAERMRIDNAGNVGIGNTAANVNDQVGGVRPLLVSRSDTSTTIAGSLASIVIGNADTTTNNTSQLTFAALTGANGTYFASAAINCVFGARTNGQYPTGQLVFSTSTSLNSAPTEKMRITSGGQVLVGTTSGDAYNPLQVQTMLGFATVGGFYSEINHNLIYASAAWRNKNQGPASQITLDGGASFASAIRFSVSTNATSTAANTAINLIEAMRIDSSGNVGIGTSSPDLRLTLQSSGDAQLSFKDTGGTTRSYIGTSGTFGSAPTGALRIRSDQGGIVFGQSGFENMRLDTSGNLLVGTTSQPNPGFTSRIAAVQSNANAVASMDATNASGGWGIIMRYTASAPNGIGNEAFTFNDSSALRFAVRSNGGIANFQANNVNLSDRREKTNFAPAGEYLSKICAIPVQTFNYIDQNMEEDPGLTLGVVAQDVQAVAPELVMESNWGTNDEPKMRLSIYQTDLQYALMKCIQEQQAIIEQLKADVAALKGA